jgi:hypothetical protein
MCNISNHFAARTACSASFSLSSASGEFAILNFNRLSPAQNHSIIMKDPQLAFPSFDCGVGFIVHQSDSRIVVDL